MDRWCSLTSVTNNYMQYLNVQLNAMDYYGHAHDVHIIALDLRQDYLNMLRETDWTFPLYIHERSLNEYEYRNKNQQSKKARYHGIKDYCMDYDVLLFLDADLFPVANLDNFFKMIDGTDVILGVNERFKWSMKRYTLNGETMPDVNMEWMICNAPIFFSPKKHGMWIDKMIEVARGIWEPEKNSSPSDLFTLNVATWVAGMQYNVIAQPHYLWTQTHKSLQEDKTKIKKLKDGRWKCWTGEQVWTIHGRWDKPDKQGDEYSHIRETFDWFNTKYKLCLG